MGRLLTLAYLIFSTHTKGPGKRFQITETGVT